MPTEMPTKAEIADLGESAEDAAALVNARFERLEARSIAERLADLETAMVELDVSMGPNGEMTGLRKTRLVLEAKAFALRQLTSLRQPAISEVCRIAGCGAHAGSIV